MQPDLINARLYALNPDEIHVYQADLRVAEPLEKALYELLSRDERDRASEFVDALHRRRFVVARGLLRMLLSAYTGQGPGDLQFRYGAQGKPEMCAPAGAESIEFNLSHSEDVVIYAITRDRALGIDVEHVKDFSGMQDVAEMFFSPQEVREWRSSPAGESTKAFYRCWTRKEAFIKALGSGVSYPLDRFDVTLGDQAELASLEDDRNKAAGWTLYNCGLPDAVAGAVAVHSRGLKLVQFALDAVANSGLPAGIRITVSPRSVPAPEVQAD